uniref:RagB/SusD family nutrient uptake outer membrane protein n=1 Tax=uncultured Draconibacterium sp. TaxID=1573823 RepID=UPI0032180C93
MKKIHKSILVIFILTTVFSCTDNLEKDPIGLLTIDQVDSNPTAGTIESSVSSAYLPLKNTLNGIIGGWRWDLGTIFRNDIVLQDIASNDMNKKWNPDGDQPWMDKISDFSFTSENAAFNGIWVYDYEGISRANLAISFLTDAELIQSTGISNSRKDQLLSEAYFLRAFYYFDLVNNFGGVPLILKSPDSFEEAFTVSVRASATDIWTQINADLTAAKAVASNNKYSSETEPWRVSKGAIIALQAKVALFNDEWPAVLSLVSELDVLGFYNLNANYFDCFNVATEFMDDEVIFAYDHRSDETPRNGNGLGSVAGWGFFSPTEDFVDAFEPNDPRLLYTIDIENKQASKLLGSTTEYRGNGDSPGNKVYIRYADVLLWKAEALIETGDMPGAIAIINQIRERARTTPTADGSVIPEGTLLDREASSSKTEVMDWLMHERRVELGFESQRFNDLKRWGTAKTVLTALGRNYQDHNALYPIPQRDIDKSGGSIVQNPGY